MEKYYESYIYHEPFRRYIFMGWRLVEEENKRQIE